MTRRQGYGDSIGWQCFSVAPFEHEITRTAENQFELRVLNGELFSTPFERLMRGRSHPFQQYDRVDLGEYAIDILELGTWGPSVLRVTFKQPLESGQYRFLVWRDGEMTDFKWPASGESFVLSPRDGYFAWPHFKKRINLL